MANYFLAGVGRAEAYRKVDGKMAHFFSANTLSDSSISISVSSEEVRGGQGAKLLGQFFHSSVLNLTMVDVVFRLDYIAAQIGGHVQKGVGGIGLKEVTLTLEDGAIELPSYPVEILPGTGAVVSYHKAGTTNIQQEHFANPEDGPAIIEIAGTDGDEYCVYYYETKEDADLLVVSSDFVPAEISVVLTTKLFAGDATAIESGRPVGSVTIKIPRFQLNGTTDIAMAMTSAATISIEGTALSYEDGCEGGRYAEIVQYTANADGMGLYSGFEKLVWNKDGFHESEPSNLPDPFPFVVYAVGPKKTPERIPHYLLDVDIDTGANYDSDTGLIEIVGPGGEITFALKDYPELNGTGSFHVGE